MREGDPGSDQPFTRAPAGDGTPYLFGDLLALARAHWIARMAQGVAAFGYPGYRPTDAALVRLLRRRGSVSINQIGTRLGVTRQAARKLVNGLERRGYANEERDASDGRLVNVALTSAGERYAEAVVAVIHELNRELSERVGRDALVGADSVLRAVITDRTARDAADRMVAPP
jgi:DNA-binding MarR family transcriptional regulator